MDKFLEGFGKVIEGMAAKLGVATEKVLEIYAKQMFVEGITGIIVAVLLWLVVYGFYKFSKPVTEFYDDSYSASFLETIGPILYFAVFLIIGIIALIYSFGDLPVAIGKLVNPEYYMIKDAIKIIGGK